MIRIDGPWFKDEFGRTLLLRGANLSGSTKVPYRPNGATHIREGFFDHRTVSFVGRPFPLEVADEHFARLRSWGLTFLRFLITWEAVEHAGPGIYDQEYLDYLVKVVRKAGEYGINLFIDPHQDAWSRFSGGDGAPGWIFEMLGMDITRFSDTGAAYIHWVNGDPFPAMIWVTNYAKYAAATLFTLFFGGNIFAPRTMIEGVPVQEYLQQHYIEAVKQVVMRFKGLPNVIGYDTLNEPSAGYIGYDIRRPNTPLYKGDTPTIWQGMLLASGNSQEVDYYKVGLTGMRKTGKVLLNPEKVSLWHDGYECVWKQNGVWEVDSDGQLRLLRPDHFKMVNGKAVDFDRDFYKPFAIRFAREIRSIAPDTLIFLEELPQGFGTGQLPWTQEDAPNVVHAAHWYDNFMAATKLFFRFVTLDTDRMKIILGSRRVQQLFIDQLAEIKNNSAVYMGNCPTLIGEFGVQFDMNNRRAYRTGDFKVPTLALDMYYKAMEANLLSCTIWNYTPDNTNERGDQWNSEDLSIFSPDQKHGNGDLSDGGRSVRAFVRPYARATAGEPLRMVYDIERRIFEFEFRHDAGVNAPTEIFVPKAQFPQGGVVKVSDGNFQLDADNQSLLYYHESDQPVHTIEIRSRI